MLFQFFNIVRIKEPSVFGFKKKLQNQRPASSSYSRNIKELAVFMKEPGSLEGSLWKISQKNEDSKFHTKISFSKNKFTLVS
jgi:hypothetical protein